jgi:hypothetical protein
MRNSRRMCQGFSSRVTTSNPAPSQFRRHDA